MLHGKSFDGDEMAKVNGELGAVVGGTEEATQQILEAAEAIDQAASALGVNIKLNYDAATGVLAGRIDQAAPAAPRQLTLHMLHATAPDKDIALTLHTLPDGSFSAPLPLLERTRWQVKVEDAQRRWRLAGSWSWPAQRGVLLRPDPQR